MLMYILICLLCVHTVIYQGSASATVVLYNINDNNVKERPYIILKYRHADKFPAANVVSSHYLSYWKLVPKRDPYT